MNFHPVADMTWGIIIIFMGMASFVYVVPLTIIVEAFFLRRILQLTFWRSILDASVMNILTGIIGSFVALYTVGLVLGPMTAMGGEPFLGADYYTPTRPAFILALVTLMGTSLIVSIIVEGIVLLLMERKRDTHSIWKASFVTNMVSNLALFVIFSFYVFYIG